MPWFMYGWARGQESCSQGKTIKQSAGGAGRSSNAPNARRNRESEDSRRRARPSDALDYVMKEMKREGRPDPSPGQDQVQRLREVCMAAMAKISKRQRLRGAVTSSEPYLSGVGGRRQDTQASVAVIRPIPRQLESWSAAVAATRCTLFRRVHFQPASNFPGHFPSENMA